MNRLAWNVDEQWLAFGDLRPILTIEQKHKLHQYISLSYDHVKQSYKVIMTPKNKFLGYTVYNYLVFVGIN